MISCNICNSDNWADFAGRPGAKCATCGSLERTRLLKLYLDKRHFSFNKKTIFHCAPEPGLYNLISSSDTLKYQAVDFNPKISNDIFVEKFDLCVDSKNLPANYFDIIIHNHVMEHIICDTTAVFYHLHRSLKNDGLHCFSLPFHPSRHYEESLRPLSEKERAEKFGQKDHVRWFSVVDFSITIGMVFDIKPYDWYPINNFTEDELCSINFPEKSWNRIDGSTIFVCSKSDIGLS